MLQVTSPCRMPLKRIEMPAVPAETYARTNGAMQFEMINHRAAPMPRPKVDGVLPALTFTVPSPVLAPKGVSGSCPPTAVMMPPNSAP